MDTASQVSVRAAFTSAAFTSQSGSFLQPFAELDERAYGVEPMKFDGVVVTQLKDRRPAWERHGVRCWRSAELASDGWFVVEHCLESEGQSVVRQWVAPTFQECQRLLRVEGAHWSKVMAYLRLPLSVASGFVFAEVAEVYEAVRSGNLVIRFVDGFSVFTLPAVTGTVSNGPDIDDLRLVFSKGAKQTF